LLFSQDKASASQWVNLWTDHKWSMPRPPYEDSYRDGRRQIWMNIEAALVKRSDAARLQSKDAAKEVRQSTVHGGENYKIFLGEIGWSEAAKHFLAPYYGQSGWPSAFEGLRALTASFGYLRERNSRDCSIGDESVRLRAPSDAMLSLLEATWSGVSATYVNKSGLVVAFDPSVNVAGPSALLVRRETLAEVLRQHDLLVCWVVHGEKLDAAGAPNYGVKARRSFQGIFLWDGKKVSGTYAFEAIETPDPDDM
jgi:hypothetical protein